MCVWTRMNILPILVSTAAPAVAFWLLFCPFFFFLICPKLIPHWYTSSWLVFFGCYIVSYCVYFWLISPLLLQTKTWASLAVQWLRLNFQCKGRRFYPWSENYDLTHLSAHTHSPCSFTMCSGFNGLKFLEVELYLSIRVNVCVCVCVYIYIWKCSVLTTGLPGKSQHL